MEDNQLEEVVKDVDELIVKLSKKYDTHILNVMSIILARLYTTSEVANCEDGFKRLLEYCLEQDSNEVKLH